MVKPKTTIHIGPYWQGERPEALTYQFLDSDGSPVPISGFTAKFEIEKFDGTTVSASATVSDGANGKVTYAWGSTDNDTVGATQGQFWAGDGASVKYASPVLSWTVVAPPVAAPAV